MISWNLTSCFFFFCVAPLGFVESGGDADSDVALSRMASYELNAGLFGVHYAFPFSNLVPLVDDNLVWHVCDPSVGRAPYGKFAVSI